MCDWTAICLFTNFTCRTSTLPKKSGPGNFFVQTNSAVLIACFDFTTKLTWLNFGFAIRLRRRYYSSSCFSLALILLIKPAATTFFNFCNITMLHFRGLNQTNKPTSKMFLEQSPIEGQRGVVVPRHRCFEKAYIHSPAGFFLKLKSFFILFCWAGTNRLTFAPFKKRSSRKRTYLLMPLPEKCVVVRRFEWIQFKKAEQSCQHYSLSSHPFSSRP